MNESDITVFNAHSGESLRINRYYFVTLDELKRFCSNQLNIPSNQLFLISPFGIKLKRTSSLEETNEIYIFDKKLFADGIQSDEFIKSYISTHYSETFDNLIQPISSPLFDVNLERISASKNSRQMISLLTTNLGWAAAIESDSSLFHKKIIEIGDKIRVLFKAIRVASQYIDAYCLDIKKKYDTSIDFAINIQNQSLNLTWKDHYKKLTYIPLVHEEEKPLSSLLDQRELENQARECIKLNDTVNSELMAQKGKLETSKNLRAGNERDLDILETETTKLVEHLESEEDLKELRLLADKVQADTKHLLGKSNTSLDDIDVELILDTFQTHKSDFVSKIHKLSVKLYKTFVNLKNLDTKLQLDLSKHLKRLTSAQAQTVSVKDSLKTVSKKIEQIQKLESSLSHTIDLPLLYGLYIVEDIRRKEWLDEIKSLTSKTVENFASLREREIKLRTQWIKNFGAILKLLNYNISSFNNRSIANIDVNISEDKSSIEGTVGIFMKEDALNYLDHLRSCDINQDTINLIKKALNDLPLRKARIRLEEVENADPNGGSEHAVKGYKARIKKLESLLHQEQFKQFSQWPSQYNESRFPALSRYSLVFDKAQNKSQLKPTSTIEPSNVEITKLQRDRSLSPSTSPSASGGNQPDFHELGSLKLEKNALMEKMKKMTDTIEVTNSELKLLKRESAAKDFENQNLLEKLDHIKDENLASLAKVQLEITNKEKEKSQLDELASNQKQEISNLKRLLQEGYAIIEDLKIKHESEVESFEAQLQKKNEELTVASKNSDEEELIQLRKELRTQNQINSSLKEELETKDQTIEEMNDKIKEQDSTISKLQSKDGEIEGLTEQRDKIITANIELNKELDKRKNDYNTLSLMKNDLLENMSNRENEFGKEKKSHQAEIESLKMKIEELEKLQEQAESKDVDHNDRQTILQLVIIINSLIIKSRDLSEILFNNYSLFCATLRSIGLLAVRIESGEVDIIRVKGLRKLGENSNLSNTVEISKNGARPDLEQEVFRYLSWPDLPNSRLITDLSTTISEEDQSRSLDLICETMIENYNLTNFEDKYLSFVDHVTNLTPLYKASISKRFREVENLAKRELKENKKFKDNEGRKISIRDFKVNDSVLFLPTRSNNDQAETRKNSWAAFNDMGDMKYLLKNDLNISPTKQWIIGKILNIEQVENDNKEFSITAENVSLY